MPVSAVIIYSNFKKLKGFLAASTRRRKKKKRNFTLPSALINENDETCYGIDYSQLSKWKTERNKLLIFQSSLNHKKSFTSNSDAFPVVFDSGSSSTRTTSKEEFLPGPYKPLKGVNVSGIASGLSMVGCVEEVVFL